MRRVLLYGSLGGLLLALLQVIEYAHFVRLYPGEIYGGLLAVLFTAVGLAIGRRSWRGRQVVVVEREVAVAVPRSAATGGPFEPDLAALARLGMTEREHEILALIAEGLSNREIGERLYISENTVKTHASRVFSKLDVRRRVQAVQRARELRLVP